MNTDKEERIDNLLTTHFDFCCCGQPEEALLYIRDVLQHIDNIKHLVWENKQTYHEWVSAGNKIFTSIGAEYFAYYVMDKAELTEHGGAVPGWLSLKGEQLLKDIKEIFPIESQPPRSPDSPPAAAPEPLAAPPSKPA